MQSGRTWGNSLSFLPGSYYYLAKMAKQKKQNSADYYLQQICPAGSTLYYSLLYQPDQARETMILIEAFYQAIYQIIYKVSEPAIAKVKLQWWHEEVSRMFSQTANHPITKRLQAHTQTFNLNQGYFSEIINGVTDYLNNPALDNNQAAYTFYCRTAGSRELLKASILKKITPELIKPIYQAASGIAIAEDFSFATKALNQPLTLADKYLASHAQLPQTLRIRTDISLAILKKVCKNKPKQTDIWPIKKLLIAWKNK
jgi:hypothetical protein